LILIALLRMWVKVRKTLTGTVTNLLQNVCYSAIKVFRYFKLEY